jgi:hypothetical protein
MHVQGLTTAWRDRWLHLFGARAYHNKTIKVKRGKEYVCIAQHVMLSGLMVGVSATLIKGEADFLQQAIRVLDSKDLKEEGIYR